MNKIVIISLIVMLVIFINIGITAQDILNPTDDADVYQDYPDLNFGSSQTMTVGCISLNWRNSLIKFDISSYTGATINDATLRLFIFGSSGEFPTDEIYIARNEAEWDEGTVTWNNRPGFLEDTPVSAPSAYDWWEIDITGWVQEIANGVANYGWQIFQSDLDEATFVMITKESSDFKPELVIDYNFPAIESTSIGSIKALFE